MSLEAKKYLESASKKINAGNKKDAESDLDLAEMEIDMLSGDEVPSLQQQLIALKNALSSTEINPQKREGVLSSLERRAETVKMRLQNKDTAKYEIADFEEFFKREENFDNLTAEDREKIQKQIEGFKKISQKYALEEIMTDLHRILKDLENDYQNLLNAFDDGNYSSIDRALSNAESTGRRFESETEHFKENEEVKALITTFEEIKIKIGKAVKANNEKERQAEENKRTQQEEEERRREQTEQAKENAFFDLPATIPPAIQADEYGKPLGRILFSKNPIPIGKEDISSLSNQFEAGDEIYAMVYLPDTLKNLGFANGFKIYIRDAETTGYSWIVEYSSFNFRTKADGTTDANDKHYDLDVFATHENAWDKNIPNQLLNALVNFLGEQNSTVYQQFRTHTWQLEMSANYKTVAKGVFQFTITKESAKKIEAMHKTHVNAHLKDFKLPESKRQDDALAEKIKQVMIGHNVNVQKVVFSTADWGIIRHELSGVVLCRSIWAYIIYKNEEGNCYYDDVQFIEEFVGNDFNGTIKKAGYGTANGQILPENF